MYKALLGGVQTVAVKVVGGQHDPAGQARFCREVAILRSCRAANVVMFCGACVAGTRTMIVCEFMEGTWPPPPPPQLPRTPPQPRTLPSPCTA